MTKRFLAGVLSVGFALSASAAVLANEWYEYVNSSKDKDVQLAYWGDYNMNCQLAVPVTGVAVGEKVVPVVTCGSMPREAIGGASVMTDQEMYDIVIKPILSKKSKWSYDSDEDIFEYEGNGWRYAFNANIWPSAEIVPDRRWIIVKTQSLANLTGYKSLAVGIKGTDDFVLLDIKLVQENIKPDTFVNRVTFPGYDLDEWDYRFFSRADKNGQYFAGNPAVPEMAFWDDVVKVAFPEAGTLVMTAGPSIEQDSLSITGNYIANDIVSGSQQWDVTGETDYEQDWFWACGMTSLFRGVSVTKATTLTFSAEDGFYPRRMLFYPASSKSLGVTGVFAESEGGFAEYSNDGWKLPNGEAPGYVKGSGTYKVGETVLLAAIASPDYVFEGWELKYGSLPTGTDLSKSTLSFKVTEDVAGTPDERKQTVVWARWRRLPVVMGLALPQGSGNISGNGAYEQGSTFSLIATPAKGYDFVQWSDGVMTTARTVTVPNTGTQLLYACFEPNGEPTVETLEVIIGNKVEFDVGLVGYTVNGLPGGLKYAAKTGKITGTAKTAGEYEVTFTKNGEDDVKFLFSVREEVVSVGCTGLSDGAFTVGVARGAGGIPLEIESETGVKSVAVAKLPAGMKYDKKTGLIVGAPTKAGDYAATITVTTKSGTKRTETIVISAEPLPDCAVGTFNGFVKAADGVENIGTLQLTSSDVGKLSAKVMTAAGTYSFSGTCWDSVCSNRIYSVALTTKKGDVLALTLDSEAGWDENHLTGTFAAAGLAVRDVVAQRNAFSKAWYFAAEGDIDKGWSLSYAASAKEASLTLTLDADGTTKIAGKLGTLSVKASGYSDVTCLPNGFMFSDFVPVVSVNAGGATSKRVLSIHSLLWLDRSNNHAEGAGSAKLVNDSL